MSGWRPIGEDKYVPGTRVRDLRAGRGWSQKRLAQELEKGDGIASESYIRMIRRWERGANLSAHNIQRLLSVFTINELFGPAIQERDPSGEEPLVASSWQDLLPFAETQTGVRLRGLEPCIGDFDSFEDYHQALVSAECSFELAVANEGQGLARAVWTFWQRTGVQFRVGTFLHALFLERLDELVSEMLYRAWWLGQQFEEEEYQQAVSRAAWSALVACMERAHQPESSWPDRPAVRSIGERLVAAEVNGPRLNNSWAAA